MLGLPAHRAYGVDPQNWLHPSHPELYLSPAGSALKNAGMNMLLQNGHGRWMDVLDFITCPVYKQTYPASLDNSSGRGKQ